MGTTGLALQKRLRHLHLFTFDFGRWTSFFFWLSWLSQQRSRRSLASVPLFTLTDVRQVGF